MADGAGPNLVETRAKVFLKGALKHSHEIRHRYTNHVYNIGLAILLVVVFGGLLLLKYKGKLTPAEKEIKKRKEYEHVLVQLKKLEDSRLKDSHTMLTDLPLSY